MKQENDFPFLLISIACAIALVFTTLFLSVFSFNRVIVTRRDFIVYWATGQQLVHHGNPYDPDTLGRVERDAGFTGRSPYYMRNIPWALPLALPLGYGSPQATALAWSLLSLGLLITSVRILWKDVGGAGSHFDWLGYCFPPALYCIILGQTSIFLLFGLALFLHWHKRRPFAAGAALWFCTLKPHLFLPFAVVLLVWIAVSRNYRVLAGGVSAAAVASAVTTLIDPAAWGQYVHYLRTSEMTHEFTACFGDVLRNAINPTQEWLAFVPAVLGCIWGLAYFWPRRHTWDWFENGNPLMLVSLIVAPYAWVIDHALAIPAILFAISRTSSRMTLSALAFIYLMVEAQIVSRLTLHSPAYLWVAPAWLAWYIAARLTAVNRAGQLADKLAEQ